ncbi:MAG: YdgA family protein [Legionellaceae bacterium]|nr:YdgA family protein [Legionellaceae bacterium]
MKRIIGVLVLLLVIVLSGYFITGLVTENTLKKNVSTFNQANLLSVELTEYHRGLLKSEAELSWRMQTPEKIIHQEDGRSLVVPPKSYIFDMPFTIYHGPIIFEHGHIHLGLGMAHGELSLPETYLNEFDKTFASNSTQPHLMLNAFVTYLNKTQLEVDVPAFKLLSKDDQNHVEWLGMNSSFVFSPKRARMQGDVAVDGLHLMGEQLQLIFEKLTSSYDMYRAENGLYLGDARVHLPILQLSNKDNGTLKIKQLDVSSNSEVDRELFASQLHVSFETLIMHDKTYGPAELDMSTQNLDEEVLANLNNQAHQLQQAGVNRSQAQQALLSLLPDVPKLLSQGAVFEMSKLKIKLPDGLMDASLRIAFPETEADAPLQILPNVEGAGQLKMPAAFVKSLFVRSYKQKLLMASINADSPVTEKPDEAYTAPVNLDQQAIHQADQKLADLIRAGAFQAKERDYVLDLKLSAGRLLVNGHPFNSGMLNF